MQLYNSQTPLSNRGLNLQDSQTSSPQGLNLVVSVDYLAFTKIFDSHRQYLDFSNELARLFSDRFDWENTKQKKIGQWYEHSLLSVQHLQTAYNIFDDGKVQSIFQIGGALIKSISAMEWMHFCSFKIYPLNVKCTRIDICADDDSGVLFDIRTKILALCDAGDASLVSGFRAYHPHRSGKIGGVQINTLYMGSRQSEKCTRIYDKIKEKEEREEKRREENGTEEKDNNGTEENGKEKDNNGTEEKDSREKRREVYRLKRREEKRKRRERESKEKMSPLCPKQVSDTSAVNLPVEIYTRWETEYKGASADSRFRFLCEWYRSYHSEEDILLALQAFMVDFIFTGYQFFSQRLNASLQRKNIVCEWWTSFLSLINHVALKLPTVRPVRTIAKTIAWLEKSVAPSIALLRRYMGGRFTDWLNSLYISGDARLSDSQLLMLELHLSS
jgi:hypothetical protein